MEHAEVVLRKQEFRRKIGETKRNYYPTDLAEISRAVIFNLEKLEEFQNAEVIFVYPSMADEVNTHELIRQYAGIKKIVLPVVTPEGLVLKLYSTEDELITSPYGIKEPIGDEFADYDSIDLAIIPGVAFDRQMHRIGRGKGYYDRLLPKLKSKKIAICFDFQLFDAIPTVEEQDQRMDMVVSQNEVVVMPQVFS